MTDEAGKWDIAISFASGNERLALHLLDALQPPHSVFVYSKAQEHLADRDAVEAFRAVFREYAPLVVILYTQPWVRHLEPGREDGNRGIREPIRYGTSLRHYINHSHNIDYLEFIGHLIPELHSASRQCFRTFR